MLAFIKCRCWIYQRYETIQKFVKYSKGQKKNWIFGSPSFKLGLISFTSGWFFVWTSCLSLNTLATMYKWLWNALATLSVFRWKFLEQACQVPTVNASLTVATLSWSTSILFYLRGYLLSAGLLSCSTNNTLNKFQKIRRSWNTKDMKWQCEQKNSLKIWS